MNIKCPKDFTKRQITFRNYIALSQESRLGEMEE